ncbi:MAG: S1 RNA-binding domain-containing protein [Parcubacteria group bacterium]|nr:S1 RNA-binding domain-containing protein [Parcubacteria group bacterium]
MAQSTSAKSKSSDLDSLVNEKTEEIKKEEEVAVDEFVKAVESQQIPQVGDKIKGKILDFNKNEVYIDLEKFGVGVVRGRELWEALDVYREFKIGEEVEAEIVELENENGMMELSFKKTSKEQAWKELDEKRDKEELITVKVQEANKGGLLASLCGIPAFLPVSQLSSENYPRVENGDSSKILSMLKDFIGRKLNVKIITVDQKENKLIISEKKVVFDDQKKNMKGLKVGDTVDGTVSGIVDFGAFVRFDGLEGLVHISELSWQRINNPDEVVKVNEQVKVEVIGIDDSKITLSMKKLKEDPWAEAVKSYKVGQIVDGEVIKIAPYGAFVQLDKDIHGLAHISELSAGKVAQVEELLSVGSRKKFKILSIDPEEHRLGLSLKGAEESPAEKNEKAASSKKEPAEKKEDKKVDEKPAKKVTKKDEKSEKKEDKKKSQKKVEPKDKKAAKTDSKKSQKK